MSEKTKSEKKAPENRPEEPEKDSWAKDQNRHKYYYDDDYGYETYSDETDEDDSDPDLPETC
jgi:hypothetical protein